MKEVSIRNLLRSKEEKRILTGKISGIEDEYYKYKNIFIYLIIRLSTTSSVIFRYLIFIGKW